MREKHFLRWMPCAGYTNITAYLKNRLVSSTVNYFNCCMSPSRKPYVIAAADCLLGCCSCSSNILQPGGYQKHGRRALKKFRSLKKRMLLNFTGLQNNP